MDELATLLESAAAQDRPLHAVPAGELSPTTNNFDVKWVMSQVGHADSKMTMDVYAQVEQRADRRHRENFDRLVAEASR